jgi:PAS domain S-box-containing protein
VTVAVNPKRPTPFLGTAIASKNTMETLLKSRRAVKILTSCNKVLMRSSGESELLTEICRILVEVGGYRFAWIASADNQMGDTNRPVACFGFEAEDLDRPVSNWVDFVQTHNMEGRSIRTAQRSVWVGPGSEQTRQTPMREAEVNGTASRIVLPLVAGDETFGTLHIHSEASDTFDHEETDLLEDVAESLSHGIATVRIREVRDKAERDLRKANKDLERQLQERTAEVHEIAERLEREIHERTALEEDLQASSDRYRRLYEKTPAMMHSIDANVRLISVSDYWLKKFGYERHEVLGRRSTDLLTDESRRSAHEERLPKYFGRGWIEDVPYQFIKKNGEVMDVLLSATAEKNADGNVERSLAVLVDVTERNRAEDALRENRALLEPTWAG